MSGFDGTPLNLSQIAQLAGVNRATVANWRRVHQDFPATVGGTEYGPEFDPAHAAAWLRVHGRGTDDAPRDPARLDFGGGRIVTLRGPSLFADGEWRDLGGYVDQDVMVPWPTADVRVEFTYAEPFEVAQANIDLKSYGMPWLYLRLGWVTAPHAAVESEAGDCPAQA